MVLIATDLHYDICVKGETIELLLNLIIIFKEDIQIPDHHGQLQCHTLH